jgi:hypothetical protein
MDERHAEALEQQLGQDVAEFRRSLIASNPSIDPTDLQQKIGAYAVRRKAALGLFICAST